MSEFLHTFPGDLNYHISKSRALQERRLLASVNFLIKNFLYALQQHKNIENSFSINAANVAPENINNKVVNMIIEGELRLCQHFLLYSELGRARHKVFDYTV